VVATGPEEDGDLEKKSDQRREARERRHSEIRSSSSVLFDPPHVNHMRLFILYPPSLDLLGRATSTTHRSIAAHMLCQVLHYRPGKTLLAPSNGVIRLQ
jgi:hypothetical protein